MDIVPGDLVRMRVIGVEEETARVLRELAEDPAFADRFNPVPALETRRDETFGLVDVVQDFIVGAGVELTGAAVTAAVHTAVVRIRKRHNAKQEPADEITVAVQGKGVTEVVVRLQSDD